MKKLITCVALTAALFTAPIAKAEVILFSVSKAGGAIMLGQQSQDCLYGKRGYLKMGALKSSETLGACWVRNGSKIHVFYDDGDTMEYPISVFRTLDIETNEIGEVEASL